MNNANLSAEERKRQRLEAWKRKQQLAAPKVVLALKAKPPTSAPRGRPVIRLSDDTEESDEIASATRKPRLDLLSASDITGATMELSNGSATLENGSGAAVTSSNGVANHTSNAASAQPTNNIASDTAEAPPRRKKARWGRAIEEDSLDQFMNHLQTESLQTTAAESNGTVNSMLEPDTSQEAQVGRLDEPQDSITEDVPVQKQPNALEIFKANKKKDLKVDHSDLVPFIKNLYTLAKPTSKEHVQLLRAQLAIRVRGKAAPPPIEAWEDAGLPASLLEKLQQQGLQQPFAIQAQCIPALLAGRDVIGIAPTGSGKTLAYLLPLIRHVLAQNPLQARESGPMGLILAPARELAYQIYSVGHVLCKAVGLV
jgi:DEAD/DEAH box helicase